MSEAELHEQGTRPGSAAKANSVDPHTASDSATAPSAVRRYPLFLDIHDRLVVVIGAGVVGERKIGTLLSYGAKVRAISPEASPAVRQWAADPDVAVEWLERPYQEGDLAGCQIAFCACGVDEVEQRVMDEANERGVLVNVVDVPHRCDFYVPSIVERGPLTIAISTNGTSPTEAKGVRRHLENHYDESWGPYLTLLGEMRSLVKARIPGGEGSRKPILEAACTRNFRERLANGEAITAEEAFEEAVHAAFQKE
jgi:precorrin-2 dehydrogenase/sirohydrochlorin ferrochelatase